MLDFNKENRLINPSDFQSVFKRPSKKISTDQLVLLLQANNANEARLGLVVPKQKAKKAVIRNQIRRIIRESFRHQKNLLKGWDIIVLLRTQWFTCDKKALRKQVDQLWRRINPL